MSKSKKVISTAFLFSAISVHTQLNAVSMVYNFRIAQLTKQPIFTKTHANVHSVVILPFNTFYRKYNGHTQTMLAA